MTDLPLLPEGDYDALVVEFQTPRETRRQDGVHFFQPIMLHIEGYPHLIHLPTFIDSGMLLYDARAQFEGQTWKVRAKHRTVDSCTFVALSIRSRPQ
jgi:hypothetical protein